MRGSSNMMPKKERLPSPGEAETKMLNNRLLSLLKQHASLKVCVFARFVPPGLSTSVNTAPKRVTVAGIAPLLSGTKKMLGDIAANWGEQALAEGAEDVFVGQNY